MISWSYALRELDRRRFRSLLSLLSVSIAVAAIVAVTSATATTRKAYQQVFQALAGRADLEVVARGGGRFQQDVADKLREIPGVDSVVPVFHRATIIYAHGTKAKVLAVGIVKDEPESVYGYDVSEGHLPEKPNEVALEASLATGLKIKAGDEIKLLTARGLRTHIVAGLFSMDNAARLRQGGMLLARVDQLQQTFKSRGEIDALHLFLKEPKQVDAVIAAAKKVLPDELEVGVPSSRTGLAEETLMLTEVSLDLASALSFTTAVFIVLSVFLMNVAERRRQLSILRAVGATRRQVVAMVCSEALVMGVVGTLIGIPLGVYGGRSLIKSMAAMLQANLPETPDLRWALITGGILGPLICLLAAWYPARKASQVSPLEGMRPVVTTGSARSHRKTTILGVLGLLVTAGLSVGSVTGDIPIWTAILGTVLSLVSLVLLMPVLLMPAMKIFGWPLLKVLGVEGEMAQRMVLRHGGRTSLTIGVLFIAVAAGVGTSNAVFSITDDVRQWYEQTITADFFLRAAMPDMSGQDTTSMDEKLKDEIAAMDGVEKIDTISLLRIDTKGQDAMLAARNFSLYERPPLNVLGGHGDELKQELLAGEVVVGSVLAEKIGVKVGEMLKVTQGDQSESFRVAGIATEYTFGGAVVWIDRAVAAKRFDIEGVDSYLIKARSDKVAALEPKLQALAQENGLLLQSFAEVLKLIDGMVNGVTGGLWVLLTLGLLVGALGVVNTLMMNVLEQTRELGMLQAIGMQRGQIIKTVLGQAAFIAFLGVLGGAISGLSLARMINISLGSMFGHYVAFAARPSFILLLLAFAMGVVMVSALVPARRAARLNPIQSMRQE